MAIEVEKLQELEYDELITLSLIESDEDLTSIFRDETQLSFSLLRTIAMQGKLNDETKALMRSLFDSIICTKAEYIKTYLKMASGNYINPIKVEETTESKVEVIKPEIKKVKKDGEIPRRYGKVSILKDIEGQGGKATPTQRAMLKVNDLKNLWVNLSARGIKDMVGGSNLLSDEDCRKIVSAITIVERQLHDILKKK